MPSSGQSGGPRGGPVPISAAMVARSHGVGEARWSPSGTRMGWLDSWDSRTDLRIGPADGSAPAAVVTAEHPVTPAGAYGGGGWCFVTDDLVAVATAAGPLVLLRADGGGLVRVLSRDGHSAAPAASPDGTWVAFSLERDDACDIAVVPVDGSQWPRRLSHGADYAWDPAWSPDSATVVWHEWDLPAMSWNGSRIARSRLDADTPEIVAGGPGEAVGQPRFSPDGAHLAWVSDRSGWWNVMVADNAGRRARALVSEPHDHAEPAWGPGQRSYAWSPDGSHIAYSRNESGFGRLVLAPVPGGGSTGRRARAAAAREPRALARAWHHGLDWGRDGILATRSGARTPTQVVATDPGSGERRQVARGPVAGFEARGLSEPEAVSWRSGRAVVHGLLWRPEREVLGPGEPPPLYVHIHGGPTDQVTVVWNARIAYWVSRGYAVLAPNYRGSSGYGRTYRDALDGAWGVADVADVAAGIRHAGKAGWGDPARVAVVGGSAGGFTVLLLAALHGDLISAAVSLFGVSDLFDLAATTHRFESGYLDGLVGALPAQAERYRDRSPVNLAGRITTPTLLLQGADDPVVPPAQAEAMAAAMRAAGAPVELKIYEGEGHGFRRLANVIDEYERTEAFLRTWLLER